jgi:hypothetical protein
LVPRPAGLLAVEPIYCASNLRGIGIGHLPTPLSVSLAFFGDARVDRSQLVPKDVVPYLSKLRQFRQETGITCRPPD